MLENRPALFTGNSSELISSEGMFPGIASIEKHHQEFLTTTPRYERFMTGESIEEWVGLLGVDVLSLGHPYATGDIAMQFAECNDRGGLVTSGTDKFTLFIASHIHDFGEIIDGVGGVGDISHDKKQENDRRQEEVVFKESLKDAFRIKLRRFSITRFIQMLFMGIRVKDWQDNLMQLSELVIYSRHIKRLLE